MTSSSEDHRRYAAVDYLKAAAIIAVIFQHAGFPKSIWPWGPVEIAMRQAWTAFHVPTFIAVSGFLYYRPNPIPISEIGSRLGRVVLPYTIASLLVIALGYGDAELSVAFKLLSGSALSIYYFVFLLSALIVSLVVISRLSMTMLAVILFVAAGVVIAQTFEPSWFSWAPYYWRPRLPVLNFMVGYFIAGWMAAALLPQLASIARNKRLWLVAAGLASLVPWVLLHLGLLPDDYLQLLRVPFSFAVAIAIVLLTTGARVPRVVRFLSEASLGIFLYHHIFQIALVPHSLTWSPFERVTIFALVGLAGGSAVCLSGRWVSPHWSRRLLGA